MKKYELTSETKDFCGQTVFRIKALKSFGNVKKGDIGGFVEKESNLSHYGDAWIYDNAIACGNARLKDNAVLRYYAIARGNAILRDDARVGVFAVVDDYVIVGGNVLIEGNAEVCDYAKAGGFVNIRGNAVVGGNIVVGGSAVIEGNIKKT
jgi:UDP-3-O-[3-hydroxymyristoyl] glucosamine N-acyltransferase